MTEVRAERADTSPVPSAHGVLSGLRLSRNKTRGAAWPDKGNNIHQPDQESHVCLSGPPAKHLWPGTPPSGLSLRVQGSSLVSATGRDIPAKDAISLRHAVWTLIGRYQRVESL